MMLLQAPPSASGWGLLTASDDNTCYYLLVDQDKRDPKTSVDVWLRIERCPRKGKKQRKQKYQLQLMRSGEKGIMVVKALHYSSRGIVGRTDEADYPEYERPPPNSIGEAIWCATSMVNPTCSKKCRRSWGCRFEGQCTFLAGSCWAGSNEDCISSIKCKSSGQCYLVPDPVPGLPFFGVCTKHKVRQLSF